MSTSLLSCRPIADTLAVADEWDRLLQQSNVNTIFLTSAWHHLWWTCLGADAQPRNFAVWCENKLIGLVPLAQWNSRVGFAGGEETADFLDFICTPGREADVLSAALDRLLASSDWEYLELRNVRANSPTRSILPSLAAARDLTFAEEIEDVSPRIALPRDWESYLASLSKKDRHELRRKLRRLEIAGDVRCAAIPADASADTIARDVDDFLRLHRLSAEEKAAFMTDEMAAYFHALVARFLPRGQLKLYFLELDGVRVAATILFDYADEYLLYNSGYDPAYGRLSVGLLLKAYCIADAIRSGRRAFDFLQGNEPYKYDLGGVDVPIYRLVLRRR